MSNPQKVLLLTGASRGIGHATVKRFSAAGSRVLTVSRQTFSEHCPWEGGEESHVQLDLSDTDGLAAGIETIREKLNGSPLHALVNNAGISPKGPNGERFSTLNSGYADWLHCLMN
jgi:NAD(P)-dependent dehydrogenase (short-subunit alcohol dehydrogenase family)